ncbi:MAG: hypothetical protein Q9166_002017 [cf. Caloplaca sp. 2 TL-2023]
MSDTERTCGLQTKKAKEADSFRSWSAAQGITTSGIDYRNISNRGLGIVAQRRLEAGEELVNVPFPALVTVNTVPKAFRKQLQQITVQGLLASFLVSDSATEKGYGPWARTWPTLADFRESMPLCWQQYGMAALTEEMLEESSDPDKLDLPFPPAIDRPAYRGITVASDPSATMGLLQKQRKKLKADWKVVKEKLPKTSFEKYVYYWFIVNTRTFYFEMPNIRTHPPREDRIVMLAIRTQILSKLDWNDFVAGRGLDKAEDEKKAQALIRSQVIEPFHREVASALGWLQSSSTLPYGICQVLIGRWTQIGALLQQIA